MILSKRKPNERLLSNLEHGEEPEFVKEQELFRERPYQVLRIEYRRNGPIALEDDVDEDALVREVHYCRDLNEVEEYVGDFGHAMEDIKWLSEIKPP